MKGKLIVISGPSGVGKGTICQRLVEKPNVALSISATTRKPRDNEIDGVHYFFKTNEEFDEMIAKDELLEWAEYNGNKYGTPKSAVQSQLDKGINVILEIEVDGGKQIKEKFEDAVLVFINPPDIEELKSRLVRRATESEQEIAERLKRAQYESKKAENYDYLVINDNLENAISKIYCIIQGENNA